jgi:hypothetical protein
VFTLSPVLLVDGDTKEDADAFFVAGPGGDGDAFFVASPEGDDDDICLPRPTEDADTLFVDPDPEIPFLDPFVVRVSVRGLLLETRCRKASRSSDVNALPASLRRFRSTSPLRSQTELAKT